MFATQTLMRLAAFQRLSPRQVLYLAYRAPPHEAGPERPFDFSRHMIDDRWQAGRLDMAEALRRCEPPSPAHTILIRRG